MVDELPDLIGDETPREPLKPGIVTCECCGRDFRVYGGDDGEDVDGVVFCPKCRPNY